MRKTLLGVSAPACPGLAWSITGAAVCVDRLLLCSPAYLCPTSMVPAGTSLHIFLWMYLENKGKHLQFPLSVKLEGGGCHGEKEAGLGLGGWVGQAGH